MEPLREGLEFCAKHDLTRKEIECALKFIGRSMTTEQLAESMESTKDNVHKLIMRLRLKGVLVMKGKTETGAIIFALK